jgi:hypothetical protein
MISACAFLMSGKSLASSLNPRISITSHHLSLIVCIKIIAQRPSMVSVIFKIYIEHYKTCFFEICGNTIPSPAGKMDVLYYNNEVRS